MTTAAKVRIPQPTATIPDLKWVAGRISQLLLQEKEHFYLVGVEDGQTTQFVRFGDAYSGKVGALSANYPMYALIQQAFFLNQKVEIGVRDFGPDPQSGIQKLIIDRVSVVR